MRGQVGRLAPRGDRLDNVRRQEGERQDQAEVPIADPLDGGEFGGAAGLTRDERLETIGMSGRRRKPSAELSNPESNVVALRHSADGKIAIRELMRIANSVPPAYVAATLGRQTQADGSRRSR